jgi:hypothetical protein
LHPASALARASYRNANANGTNTNANGNFQRQRNGNRSRHGNANCDCRRHDDGNRNRDGCIHGDCDRERNPVGHPDQHSRSRRGGIARHHSIPPSAVSTRTNRGSVFPGALASGTWALRCWRLGGVHRTLPLTGRIG